MSKNIDKALPELLEAGVITPEIAQKIQQYYDLRKTPPANRLFVIFGILGAVLVGLGLILIVAHNWDNLGKSLKTFFAFLPLAIGQFLVGYTLLKKHDQQAWTEATAAFLFFAVGACLSLVSQIYNIPGKTADFVLSWMILVLPLVYLMRSSFVSLFYIIGITYYTIDMGYWNYLSKAPYPYWLLFSAIIPHYYWLYRKRPTSNFMTFHNWILPLSLIIALGTFIEEHVNLMCIAYGALFGILYQIGQLNFLKTQKRRSNGFLVLGSMGLVILLLISSFTFFWDEMHFIHDGLGSAELFLSLVLLCLATGLLIFNYKKTANGFMDIAFLIYTLIFVLSYYYSPLGMILVNLLLFTIGITYIRKGGAEENLGILNYGLLIITALVLCRFFDTYFSFILRGILFLLVGGAFFAVNYWFINKMKTQSNEV